MLAVFLALLLLHPWLPHDLVPTEILKMPSLSLVSAADGGQHTLWGSRRDVG